MYVFSRLRHPNTYLFSPTYELTLLSRDDLRAVDDLEPLSFPEAEVVLRPRLIVVKCHKEGDSCRGGEEERHSVSALGRLAGEKEAWSHGKSNP